MAKRMCSLYVKQCQMCQEMEVKNGIREESYNEIRVSSAKS